MKREVKMSDVKGIEIHDILGLEEPLTKLIECVSNGIGKIYEPTHIKRIAKAKQEEIRVIGETVSQNINLPTSYENGNIYIDATSADELVKRTGNRLLYTELRKQQNIESIIGETYSQLKDKEGVTNEPVDQDWLFNFFNNAGDITDEKMQKIWGKILAGEIEKPNTYTLRTLNTLKNITSAEARLFEEVAPFICYGTGNNFLPNDSDLLEKYGITFEKLLKLEDCGLISLNGFVSIVLDGTQAAVHTDGFVFYMKGKGNIGVYTITECGNQILRAINNRFKNNNDFFLEFFKKAKNNNKDVTFSAYKIVLKDGINIKYDEKIDLLDDSYNIDNK